MAEMPRISLMSLWRELANEMAGWCGTSAIRDIKTVADRARDEGESFMTITLPEFGKGFERSLELGKIDPTLFRNFPVRRGRPLFLGGFLDQVFDPSGVLLDEPNIDSIRSVRELTLVFGKMKRMCSDARVASAMSQFVQLEKELAAFDTNTLSGYLPRFRQASLLLWADVNCYVENSILDTHQLAIDWTAPIREDEEYKPHSRKRPADLSRSAHIDVLDHILGVDMWRTKEYAAARGETPLVRRRVPVFLKETGQLADCEIVDPASQRKLIPRHGPGAVAEHIRGNAKFSVGTWPGRLESIFPYGDYALPQLALENELDRVQFLEPGAEVSVQLTGVPKTDKTPRLIAIEPAAMQYMQQAVFHQVVYRLEDFAEQRPPSGGELLDFGSWFVGFADQETNRVLARKGSLDGSLATLDLSEASDRVLNSHVELLFERNPALSRAIQATRSSSADVPGHGKISLAKFASMGSALCFPVEAMVFTTIVIAAIADAESTPVNRRLINRLRGKVRVYGDDIVVPVEYVQSVISWLEAFGLKVNRNKSFWNGKFRESCGGDFYAGEWVTPVRLRNELPTSLADVDSTVGLVAFRNLLYWSGYWKTASYLDEYLTVLFKGRWSIVEKTAAGLGRESVLPYKADRIDPNTHVPLVRGAYVRHKIPDSPTSGSGALLKFLIKRGLLPTQDAEHLTRQGRPVASRIKLQWIRPY
nr:MAG: hypothetical protein 3 [Leviviridae sp.]